MEGSADGKREVLRKKYELGSEFGSVPSWKEKRDGK